MPRMTKSEKMFMDRMNAVLFNPAMLRNGVRYLNTDTMKAMPENAQKRYRELLITKTR